jgi:hypothetical protein
MVALIIISVAAGLGWALTNAPLTKIKRETESLCVIRPKQNFKLKVSPHPLSTSLSTDDIFSARLGAVEIKPTRSIYL